MLLARDIIRDINPHHKTDDAVIQKVDSKPLNGVKTIDFVFLFSSDHSRLFLALGGNYDDETIKKAKDLLGQTVHRCETDLKKTKFTLVTRKYTDEKKKTYEETKFVLEDLASYCFNCPETRLIDNHQPGQDL